MKIVYIANAGSVHFIRWYEYFINRGHQVYLISSSPAILEYKIDIKGLKTFYLPDYKTHNRKLNFVINTIRLPIILNKIKKIIKQINPDILHAHQVYAEGFWAALTGFHPLIITPMGADVDTLAYQYYIYRKISKFVLKKADLVTQDSLTGKTHCINFGMKSPFELIQNGVDTKHFKCEKNNFIREKLGIAESDPVVFYARGFVELYNADKIIEAIPIILKTLPNCKFIFSRHASDVAEDLKAQELIKRMGLEKSVFFTGFIHHKEMPLYFQSADFYISVPKIDNSPCSVYEAMASGVPVILSKLPWTEYAMRDRENTYMLENITSENIAEAVINLYKNKTLRDKIIKNALATIEEKFSYQKNMKRMEELMLGLIRKS